LRIKNSLSPRIVDYFQWWKFQRVRMGASCLRIGHIGSSGEAR